MLYVKGPFLKGQKSMLCYKDMNNKWISKLESKKEHLSLRKNAH